MNYKKLLIYIGIVSFIGYGILKFGFTFKNSSNLPYGIRPYNAAIDKPAIHKMFNEDWYWMLSDYSIQNGYSIDFMLDNNSSVQYEKRHDLTFKICQEEDRVVGFSAYSKKSLFIGHILFIIVDQSARKKGYARLLVKDALQDLFAQGCIKVTLDTRTGNKRARALYTSLGFTLLEEDENYVHFAFYKDQPLPQVNIKV